MTYREPVDGLLEPGDLLTISWSGELRTVMVAMDKEGDLILRDLTDAEAEALVASEGGASPAAEPGSATCDAECPGGPSAPGGYPFMCTAAPGHAGDHAERDEDSAILAEWPQLLPEGPTP